MAQLAVVAIDAVHQLLLVAESVKPVIRLLHVVFDAALDVVHDSARRIHQHPAARQGLDEVSEGLHAVAVRLDRRLLLVQLQVVLRLPFSELRKEVAQESVETVDAHGGRFFCCLCGGRPSHSWMPHWRTACSMGVPSMMIREM